MVSDFEWLLRSIDRVRLATTPNDHSELEQQRDDQLFPIASKRSTTVGAADPKKPIALKTVKPGLGHRVPSRENSALRHRANWPRLSDVEPAFLENPLCAIALIEPAMDQFVDVNERAYNSAGYSRAEFLRLRPSSFLPKQFMSPDGRIDRNLFSDGVQATNWQVIDLCDKNGSARTVQFACRRWRQGAKDFAVAFWVDITEHFTRTDEVKTRDAYVQALLGSVDAGASIIGADGRIVAVNAAYARHSGFNNPDDLVGKHLSDIWPAHRADAMLGNCNEVIVSGQPIRHEISMPHAGTVRSFSITLSPVRLYNEIVGVAGVAHDVTDYKRMIGELQEREAELRTLTENLPDNMLWVDQGMRIRYINQHLASTINIMCEQSLGRTIHDAFSSYVDREVFINAIEAVVTTGETVEMEVPIQQSTLGLRFHRISVVPERDSQGHVNGAIAIGRDVTEKIETERRLTKREREFRTLAENSPDAIIRYNRDLVRLYTNPKVRSVRTLDEGQGLNDGSPVVNLEYYMNVLREVFETGNPRECELLVFAWGEVRTFHAQVVPELGDDGEVQSVLAISRDITELKLMHERLSAREQEFRALAENSPDSIVRWDAQFTRLYVNPTGMMIAGAGQLYKQGGSLDEGTPLLRPEEYKSALADVFSSGQMREIEVEIKIGDAIRTLLTRLAPEFDGTGQVKTVLAISRDITSSVQQRERIQRLAFSDPLTGLANRALFQERVRETFSAPPHKGSRAGLMLVDIDHFKEINDTFGHSNGDELLKQIASRLSQCVPPSDTLARLGGDEFVILLGDASNNVGVRKMAMKLLQAMEDAFHIAGKDMFVSCSIGVAVVELDQRLNIDALLVSADEALYEAKRRGRNNFQFYHNALSQKTSEKLALGQALRQSISNHELHLLYQPKCMLADGRIVGAEALLRWEHPILGTLTPDRFIKVAEENGMIVDIGDWVLAEACRTIAGINRRGGAPLTMAVNISPKQFLDGRLAARVKQALKKSRCDPSWLELEITEGVMLQDSPSVHKALAAISKMGVSIAVDDFGTGHSALAYLDRFDIDVLKIDRSFISHIEQDHRKAAIVKAFISLADAFDLEVVAEGIETPEQAAILHGYGCRIGQGFFYNRPMTEPALRSYYDLPV